MKSSRVLFAVFPCAAVGCMSVSPARAVDPPLANAAQTKYGARVSVMSTVKGGVDPQTPAESLFDNNTHTRSVLRGGLPYTITIELAQAVPVAELAFAHSDYATELAPKDLEITLDDGTTLRHTLDLKRPEKRKPVWQNVPVGKTARVIKITIRSNHEAAGSKVNWGGLGEIAVLTRANLEAKFRVADDASAPVFVHVPTAATAMSTKPVRLPVPAKPGEHPRLLLTRTEASELKATLLSSTRGKAVWKSFEGLAAGALQAPLDFPDPKGPLSQLTDRGDDVMRRHSVLSERAGTLGMAYTLTGDKRYADRAAEILRGYAERYAAYPEHKGVNKSDTGKISAQRLSEAMWLIPLIESYDHIYASGALPPSDHQKIERDLVRAAVSFIRNKDTKTEVAERNQKNPNWRTDYPAKGSAANWLLFYNTATMMAGATLDDADLKDLATADFKRLLANGIGSDGMWDEGAIGYQFFAMSALTAGVETAARQGIDLWSWDNNRFKRLFDSPLRYAYPDGSAPGINDSSRTRFGDWSTMSYDYAFLRYGDPAYGFLVNASPRQLHFTQGVNFPTRVYEPLPESQAIAFPSTVFENLGYGILRDSHLYALMDYGTHGGTHGHFDKLNLILFASDGKTKGDEIGGEPRFHRYEDALHGEWTRQTVAHNSLTVDESSQVASEGKLLVFEDSPAIKVMRAQTTASAPGARLDRTVVVLPDVVLDVYHGESAWKRTWDRTLRFQGTLAGLPAADAKAAPLGTRDGYQHLMVSSRVPAAESWSGIWETTRGAFKATVAGATDQQVLLAHGPDKDEMALVRQQGEQANFAVAYQLGAWANPVQSVRQIATGNPQLTATEVVQADGTKTTVFVAHGQAGDWQAQGWKSDARVLCVRQKGSEAKLLLAGGTFAEGANGVIRQTQAGNYHAELRQGKMANHFVMVSDGCSQIECLSVSSV